MNIAYDARNFPVNEKFDGIGRYAYELAHAMAAHTEHTFTWLICDKRQIEKLPTDDYLLISRPDDMTREIRLPKLLNTHDFDVVYSPFYTMGVGRGKRNYRLVLTIHDMTYFIHRTPPGWLPTYQRIGWWLFNSVKWPTRWLLSSADAVATVSQTARQDLERYHMTKSLITPVLNGVSQSVATTISDHSAYTNIVYMGAFTPYKNVECLIDAMAALPECTLHLLSRIPATRRKELEKRAREKALQNHVVFYDGVSDTTYHELLSEARCLVTASKAEGFGLSILEAQGQGAPVACSDIPIFHEVGGDAVRYFDPASPTDCARAIRDLSDPHISRDCIKKGFSNIRRFDWADSANAALDICESLQ